MKLYIIRHGETPWNAEGRLQGQTDIPLNENGIRLAKITGEALKDVPFDLAISSPLKRARQTADLVLAGRKIPVLEDARIEELSFGSWEGLGCRKANFEIPSEHFQDFYKDPFHFQTAVDGETIEHLCARTKAFWDDLISNPDWLPATAALAGESCTMSMKIRRISGTVRCRPTAQ